MEAKAIGCGSARSDKRWVARAGLLENVALRQKDLQEVWGSHEEEGEEGSQPKEQPCRRPCRVY